MERRWHTVYLGVGSNLGDRIGNIKAALDIINTSKLTGVKRVSKIYETEPIGYSDQGMFLNCVVEVRTLLTPVALIRFLLEVEEKLGRKREIPLGPRTIDLDILFYDNLVIALEEVIIPHPRLHERNFVLTPLCDIAPYFIHPVLNERCYRLAEILDTEGQKVVEFKEQPF